MRNRWGGLAIAVSGVEAYRPFHPDSLQTLEHLSATLLSAVLERLDTTFDPAEPEHREHVHIVTTEDFSDEQQRNAIRTGRLHWIEFEVANSIHRPTAQKELPVRLVGLRLQTNEHSVAFGYTFFGSTLAREALILSDIFGGDFIAPSVMVGEFHRKPNQTTPSQLKKALEAAYARHRNIAGREALVLGPLAIQTL